LLHAGAELPYVSRQMDHADTSITLKVYVHQPKETNRRDVNLLGTCPPRPTHPDSLTFLRAYGMQNAAGSARDATQAQPASPTGVALLRAYGKGVASPTGTALLGLAAKPRKMHRLLPLPRSYHYATDPLLGHLIYAGPLNSRKEVPDDGVDVRSRSESAPFQGRTRAGDDRASRGAAGPRRRACVSGSRRHVNAAGRDAGAGLLAFSGRVACLGCVAPAAGLLEDASRQSHWPVGTQGSTS
jgi:hypothetical protein